MGKVLQLIACCSIYSFALLLNDYICKPVANKCLMKWKHLYTFSYSLQTDMASMWIELVAHEKSVCIKDFRFVNWFAATLWLHCQTLFSCNFKNAVSLMLPVWYCSGAEVKGFLYCEVLFWYEIPMIFGLRFNMCMLFALNVDTNVLFYFVFYINQSILKLDNNCV